MTDSRMDTLLLMTTMLLNLTRIKLCHASLYVIPVAQDADPLRLPPFKYFGYCSSVYARPHHDDLETKCYMFCSQTLSFQSTFGNICIAVKVDTKLV